MMSSLIICVIGKGLLKMVDKPLFNPYASALDGLQLDDPVSAFFSFCRERENIRLARESARPAPWSDDPIFQRGRFLNVFREDDRGSKAIIRFADGLDILFELSLSNLLVLSQ